MDRLGQWIDERCVVTPDAKVKASFAYQDYRKWAEDRGEHTLPMTAFGNRLTERGIQKVKGRTITYIGIGLCDTSATLATDSQVFPPARSRETKETGNVSQLSPSVAADADAYLRASTGE